MSLSRRFTGPTHGILGGVVLAVAVVAVVTVGAVDLGELAGHHPPWAFVVAVAVGELARVIMPSGRVVAPVSTASGVGLIFMGAVDSEPSLQLGSSAVVVLVTLGVAAGAAVQGLARLPVLWVPKAARVLAIAVVAQIAQSNPFGLLPSDARSPMATWPAVLTMVALSAVAVVLEIAVVRAVQRPSRPGEEPGSLARQLREAPALTVGLATSGPIIALLAPVLGLAAIPVALFPLAMSYVALRRYLATRTTYRETITTLSRLTDLSGMTRERHADRVASLARAIGRRLGLSRTEVEQLELAALLHDVGQIGLTHAIPGGATVLAAPDDQRHIAAEGARIVRLTGVLDDVADSLEHQTTPYRSVRERGESVPLSSRILKVANAYDDFSEGSESLREVALERIHLGLGYEYDPDVVEALMQVVGWGSPPPPHHSR